MREGEKDGWSPPTLWCSLRKFCKGVDWSRNDWKARDLNSGRGPPNPSESAPPLARKGRGEGRVPRWQIKAASLLKSGAAWSREIAEARG